MYVCAGCSETKKETISATGHKYGEWKITKEPTELAEGEKERICETCEHVEKQVIAKLEPKEENNTNTENNANSTNNTANTNTAGNTTDKTTANKELPAAGLRRIIFPAIILIVVTYISYNNYIKYKDI